MRFATSLTVLFLAATAHAAAAQQDSSAGLIVSERDAPASGELLEVRGEAPSLDKRACEYNGCKCNSRGKQLTICGNCQWSDTGTFAITAKRVTSHIYECSPGGKCCDYGYAKDCKENSGRCIIN